MLEGRKRRCGRSSFAKSAPQFVCLSPRLSLCVGGDRVTVIPRPLSASSPPPLPSLPLQKTNVLYLSPTHPLLLLILLGPPQSFFVFVRRRRQRRRRRSAGHHRRAIFKGGRGKASRFALRPSYTREEEEERPQSKRVCVAGKARERAKAVVSYGRAPADSSVVL